MLEMIDVHVSYRLKKQTVTVLDRVNLTVEAGEFLSVVGPSGSGKSTLLQSLGGMLSPEKGEIRMNSTPLYDLSPDRRARFRKAHIGFVFQTFNLLPYLTALENVQLPLMLSGTKPEAQAARAASLLEDVGLKDRMDHKPSELSSGQQQRVALARMLANDPGVIFADEPTGSLDPETGREVIGFLKRLNAEGRTVVMVTHDPEAAARASRTIRLENGRISDA